MTNFPLKYFALALFVSIAPVVLAHAEELDEPLNPRPRLLDYSDTPTMKERVHTAPLPQRGSVLSLTENGGGVVSDSLTTDVVNGPAGENTSPRSIWDCGGDDYKTPARTLRCYQHGRLVVEVPITGYSVSDLKHSFKVVNPKGGQVAVVMGGDSLCVVDLGTEAK